MGFCLNFMLSWGKRNSFYHDNLQIVHWKCKFCELNFLLFCQSKRWILEENVCTILGLIYYYQKIKKKSFNPDPSGSKNITIHYPGAIFGTFIINQFTWSLFWQFWYLIVHWFNFFTKNHSLYRKSKSQIFPEFLVDDFNSKKIKQIHKDRNGSRVRD